MVVYENQALIRVDLLRHLETMDLRFELAEIRKNMFQEKYTQFFLWAREVTQMYNISNGLF
ncbi:fat-spondin [Carabus blaptoides fortunei]